MMHTADMMKAFARYRGDAILVPGRSGRYWINLSDNQPLDVELGDPAMGGHAGLGLGLALARPDKKVMLFDSEGDIQMSLGILATVAEQAPPNLYHFLIDNGVYATTGGQPVPNADKMQYDMIARGCGYPTHFCLHRNRRFRARASRHHGRPRPGLCRLQGRPGDRERADRPPPPLADPYPRAGRRPISAPDSASAKRDVSMLHCRSGTLNETVSAA